MVSKYKIKKLDDIYSYVITGQRFRADGVMTAKEAQLFFESELNIARTALIETFDEATRDIELRKEALAVRDHLWALFVHKFSAHTRPYGFRVGRESEPDSEPVDHGPANRRTALFRPLPHEDLL